MLAPSAVLLPGRASARRTTVLTRWNSVRWYSASSCVRRTARSRSPSELPPGSDDVESSTARGTRYELLCRDVLHQLFGMDLTRTGGAGDRGVDLRGWWTPSPLPGQNESRRVRVLAQCKCQDEGGKKMGPVLIREVEGVVFRAASRSPASDATEADDEGDESDESAGGVAGIVLSSSGFSKQALLQVRSSSVPLAAMHVVAQPLHDEAKETGDALAERCVSIVWNDRFGAPNGLLPGGLETRWVRPLHPSRPSESASLGRPVVYRAGKPLR